MKNCNITFVGAGNMATSLIAGLISDGFSASHISVCDINEKKLVLLASRYSVNTNIDSSQLIKKSDVVVLAVKPQSMRAVCESLAEAVQMTLPLLISVAAGIRVADLNRWLGGGVPIVRAMPNTPALVQTGATGLFANIAVSEAQRGLAENIMRAVGLTIWVEEEDLMNAVTALSGSGPAYYFLVMEAMEAAGVALGLSQEAAHLLTLQTALGAAKMALESEDSPAVLREKVTSPGGTTESALKVLTQAELHALFVDALNAANQRSQELAQQFGES